jgi:hypothetical protein
MRFYGKHPTQLEQTRIQRKNTSTVLYKVEFETLTENDKSKLFEGLTRAQMRVDVVHNVRVTGFLPARLWIEQTGLFKRLAPKA